MNRSSFIQSLGLLAVGAGLAVAVTHVKVDWQTSLASPTASVAAEAKPALPPPSTKQVTEARSLGRTFAEVASQVSPAVVRISVAKTMKTPQGRGMPPGFERFFGNPFGDDEGPMAGPGGKQHGMGSGVVFDQKGYILTNNHVVEGADDVKVTFIDGKTVSGKVVGTDPQSDLAVVKVDGVGVKAVRFGDSDKIQVGEWTIAIGNPMGLDHTVTVGVLSAKGRPGQGKNYQEFLQTDASINPGNSGGPLVNLDGEIIGINTMIISGSGGSVGLGFAVPSSIAKPVAEQLMNGGKVHRPYIGIGMQDLTPEMQKTLGAKAPEHGAIVGQVQPGSPADKAGVHSGDIIVKIDGNTVDGSKMVQRTILGKGIGQRVELAVWRDGKEQRVQATTGELPGEGGESKLGKGSDSAAGHAKLGLGLQTLTPQIGEQLELPKGLKGAVIGQVQPGSPAEDAGLQRGDVITEIDRKPVRSAEDAQGLLGQARATGHLLRIQRGEAGLYVAIQPGK
jgi:serine protease Do